MEVPEVVVPIIEWIPTIDFSVSKDNASVSLFETTIRYLGGMISAYDLLTSPDYSYLTVNVSLVHDGHAPLLT